MDGDSQLNNPDRGVGGVNKLSSKKSNKKKSKAEKTKSKKS